MEASWNGLFLFTSLGSSMLNAIFILVYCCELSFLLLLSFICRIYSFFLNESNQVSRLNLLILEVSMGRNITVGPLGD